VEWNGRVTASAYRYVPASAIEIPNERQRAKGAVQESLFQL
jgi:hypothetical protein